MVTKEIQGLILFSVSLAVFFFACGIALFGRKRRALWTLILFAEGTALAIAAMAVFLSTYAFAVNEIVGYVFTFISMLTFFGGLCLAFGKRKHGLWWFAGFMLITVLVLQIAINAACPFEFGNEDEKQLSNVTLAARAVSSVFQTFSLDASYSEIMAAGEFVFRDGSYMFCGMYLIMTFVAPATGGFAIFGLICHFFPYLWLLVFSFKRTRYVFSELNEYSIAIAESIVNKRNYYKSISKNGNRLINEQKWLKSSLVVFTDAYTDKAEENSSELLERAKKIGAICVKDDISECNFRWMFGHKNKKIVYFLMDIDEESNLKTATAILSPEKKLLRKVDNVELYVFSKNVDADALLKNDYNELKKNSDDTDITISYKIINEYRNLIYHLIDGNGDSGCNNAEKERESAPLNSADKTYPLYSCLKSDGKFDLSKLSIVVIGGGMIGKEFIKASYWCGQMLKSAERNKDDKFLPFTPTDLKITVLDKSALKTESRLRFEMPEVFEDVVKTYRYCTFNFINSEFGVGGDESGDFGNGFDDIFEAQCSDADYVLVALGDDELNMQAAHWVKRTLDRINIKTNKQVPINYVIENADLCSSLIASDKPKSEMGCKLHPFGSLAQRYDFDNIYMSELEQRAWIVDKAHGYTSSKSEFLMNDYNLNSSIASVLHYSYKLAVFGGAIDGQSCEHYKDMLKKNENSAPLYWLEHRRWCAYLRSIGRRCPTAAEYFSFAFNDAGMYDEKIVKAKNIELKLHACLMESGAHLPVPSEIASIVNLNSDNIYKCVQAGKSLPVTDNTPLSDWLESNMEFLSKDIKDRFDALDRLSMLSGSDFKAYDVNLSVNLYNDELRGKIIDSIYNGDTDSCANLLASLSALYKAGHRDCVVTNNNKFVRVGAWEKFHIIAAKFKDGSYYNSDSEFVLGMRNVDDITLKSVKNGGFIKFISKDTALIGICSDQSWKFDGVRMKVAYDERGNYLHLHD